MTKPKPKKKSTLIDSACRKHSSLILSGKMLSIDPSVGSTNSQPGYAVWMDGALLDSGTIELGCKANATIAQRLFKFRTSLEAEFDKPDILVLERIVLNIKARGYSNPSVIKLNQAIGVAMSQWGCPVIEVSPMSWKATAKSLDNYEKTDEWDAIALGWCVIHKAQQQ